MLIKTTRRRRVRVYRRSGLVLDDRQHRIHVAHRSRSTARRGGFIHDPGALLLICLGALLLVGWLLIFVLSR